jgi:HD-GYP domain-containing protein (c-di-GMP phosphodiesterase class II)
MVFAGQRLLSQNFNINRWILPSIALFAITVFIRPLENFLVKITDKVLYQRRYDYMITLKNAAKGMTLITDTKKLLGLMVRILSKEVRLTGCAIYIYDKEAAVYNRAVNRGFKDAETIEVVHKDSPLIDWLIEKKQPINYDSIATWIQSERIFPHQVVLKKTLEQIRVIMKRLVGSLCVPSFLRGEMIGFLVLGAKLSGDRYSADDTLLMLTLANSAAIAIENARMYAELKEKITRLNQMYEGEHLLFIDAASAFSYAIDTKDGYSHMHSLKVSDYALALTKELEKILPHMHFEKHFYDILQITSLLHDVGKIGVSDKILNKQANLTKEEEEELRKHAIKGEVILRPMKEIEEVFDLIRHHHEHYDGTGYPDHLKESEIPLISRIVAVANAYDTMTSDRPYRKAIPKKEALEELKQGAGKQFDPFVVDALVKALS